MKSFFVLIGMVFIAHFSFSQNQTNDIRVNAYLQEALNSYEKDDYEKVIYYCNRVEEISGETNINLEILRLKSYYKTEQNSLALKSLEKFFTFDPNEKQLLEIEPYIVKIEEAENYRKQKEKEEKELQERLENEAYEMALKGTPFEIKAYFSQFPQGKHYDELVELFKQREDDLFEKIMANTERSYIEKYYKYFSNGKYLREVEKRVQYIDEYELYTEVMSVKTEEAFDNYLNKFPKGRYEKEILETYANYIYENGTLHLERKNYLTARNYFGFYQSKFPEGENIDDVNIKIRLAEAGIKQNERIEDRKKNTLYGMPTYVTDKNIGIEIGGMNSLNRVSMYFTLEGKNLFRVISKLSDVEKISVKEAKSGSFNDMYFTSSFGWNVRIIYPAWVYLGVGMRLGVLEAQKGSFFYDEENNINYYRLSRDEEFMRFFPEIGAGTRIIRRIAVKAGVRFFNLTNPEDKIQYKVGVGYVF